MKIAFFVNQFPCLSETFILNQITGLIDRGHEIDIFAYGSGDDSKMHEDVNRYNLLRQTFYYGPSYNKIPVNKFLRILKGLNLIIINFHKKPMSLLKSLNVFKFKKEAASLSILYKIIPFIDKGTYDIIHCHFGPNGNLVALLKDMGVIKGKIITTFHGYDITSYIRKNGRNVYYYLFSRGDFFLPISERWKNELVRMGCNESKIIVHRMGIDTNKFQLSEKAHRNDGKVSLLTVARLVEKKGVEYGVHAVARIIDKFPDVEYRIAGDGPLRSTLEHLIEDLNAQNNIKLLGWKHQEEIAKLMKESNILLAPSVTSENGDQEGIPVVIMEAMAQGLPVLSTYHSGIPELVQDGKSGFLVPESDVDALVERLIYLIEHREIWPQIGKMGRKFVEDNYDINKLNDRLVDIYCQLLN